MSLDFNEIIYGQAYTNQSLRLDLLKFKGKLNQYLVTETRLFEFGSYSGGIFHFITQSETSNSRTPKSFFENKLLPFIGFYSN